MPKSSIFILPFLLGTAFLWNVGMEVCFASDLSPPSLSSDSGRDFETDGNAPADHSSIAGSLRSSLPRACLNGGSHGNRQLSSSQGRLTLLVRLLGGNENALRGYFSRVNDIRSYYGFVRPHLYFCRLLI